MDSHYINEPKRTSEQLTTAREAWLNKYQKTKVPELFKNQTNITPEVADSGRPTNTPDFGIGATLGRTVADVGSSFIPTRERKDPNQRINNQQRATALQTQVANPNFQDQPPPPPPSDGAVRGPQPNMEADNQMDDINDFAMPETNVNTPYNLRESTVNQPEGFYTRQLAAGPFDSPNQRMETVDYSAGDPIVPFENNMTRQERIESSNFDNLMTSFNSQNSLRKLENELQAISAIEEKYTDATSIHKKAIQGEPYKDDLTKFDKKYGTSDTQSVIRNATQEYKALMESIGTVHTEQLNRVADIGSNDVSGMFQNEVRNSVEIEKEYYEVNAKLASLTEQEISPVKATSDGVGNTQLPPDPKANIETIAQQLGVGQMSSNFYSNFKGLIASIRQKSQQYGGAAAEKASQALITFANALKVSYQSPDNKRDDDDDELISDELIHNALSFISSSGFAMVNTILAGLPVAGMMASSIKNATMSVANKFIENSSKAYQGWSGALSNVTQFMEPKTEDEIINEDDFDAEVGSTGQNPLQGLPNIKQIKNNGIAYGNVPAVDLQYMGANISRTVAFGNSLMQKLSNSNDPNEIEQITAQLERINQYLEQAYSKLYPEDQVIPQDIFGNFSVMTEFPGSKKAQIAMEEMRTNPVEYTEALKSEITNMDSRISSEVDNRPEYRQAIKDILTELKQKTMKQETAVGFLKGSENQGQYEWNIGAYRYLIMGAALVAALGGVHALATSQAGLAPALINQKDIVAQIINSYSSVVKTLPLITPLVMAQSDDKSNSHTISIMKNWLSNLQAQLSQQYPGYKARGNEIDFNLKNPGMSKPSLIADTYRKPEPKQNLLEMKKNKVGGRISHGIKDVEDMYDMYSTSMKRLKGSGVDKISETSGALKEIIKKLKDWKPKFVSVSSLDKVLDVLKRLPEFKQGGLVRGAGVSCNMCKQSKRNFKVHKHNKDDITCNECYNEHGMTGGRVTERDADIIDIDDSTEPEHVEKTQGLKTNEYLDELERVKPKTMFEDFDESANIDKRFVTRMSSDFVINRPYNQNPLRQKKDQDRLAYLLGMYEHSPETMTSAQKINMEALGINHLNMKGDPETSLPNPKNFNTHSGILNELESNPGFLKRIIQE